MSKFQSPQWGSNSKANKTRNDGLVSAFQSPQWGSNSKGCTINLFSTFSRFQSPQWGSNSKVQIEWEEKNVVIVSVPAMAK